MRPIKFKYHKKVKSTVPIPKDFGFPRRIHFIPLEPLPDIYPYDDPKTKIKDN